LSVVTPSTHQPVLLPSRLGPQSGERIDSLSSIVAGAWISTDPPRRRPRASVHSRHSRCSADFCPNCRISLMPAYEGRLRLHDCGTSARPPAYQSVAGTQGSDFTRPRCECLRVACPSIAWRNITRKPAENQKRIRRIVRQGDWCDVRVAQPGRKNAGANRSSAT